MPLRIGACGIIEYHQRETIDRLKNVKVHERTAKGGKKQWSRLPGNPRYAQQHSCHYAAQARRKDYFQYGSRV